MALQDSLDNLLLQLDGSIPLEQAIEILNSKYSKEKILQFIKNNPETYQIRGNDIWSEELQLNSFINKLKKFIRQVPMSKDLFKVIIYEYAKNCEPPVDDDNLTAIVKSIKVNNEYIYKEIEHLFLPISELDFYFDKNSKYKFSSRLFEFILSEDLKNYGLFTTPQSIIALFKRLLSDLDEVKVYNPTAGILNLASALEAESLLGMELKASEINNEAYKYGKLFAKINNLNIDYNHTDSGLEITNINDNEYDVIVSNLPFNVKINPSEYKSKYTDLAFHIISESLRILKSDGKAVFLVNESVLYSNTRNAKDFREEIVDSGYLMGIVSLPPKILIHSSVKSCVLIFDKSNSNDFVRFVDANKENFYLINRDKSLSLKVDKIITELNEGYNNAPDIVEEPGVAYGKKSSFLLDIAEIRRNNYDLNLGRYILNLVQFGDEYSLLNDIFHSSIDGFVEKNESLPYIRISELNSNIIDSPDGLSVNASKKRGNRVKGSAFLIGLIGGSFKPTLFNGDFDVEVSPGIAVYKFDNQKIFAPYLLQELNAEYVRKQMDLLTKGDVIKSITKSDLASIKIKIPPVEDQKRIYSARIDFSEPHITTTTTSSAKTTTTTTGREERTISDTDIFQTFKHEIGNILKGPEGFFDLLPQFLSRYKLAMNTPIVETEPDTIGEMLEMSAAKINQVYEVMENMKGILFSDEKYFKPTKTELEPFIEKCLKHEITNGNIKWNILINESEKSNRKIFAEIDTNQFEYIIRNMVVNIERHGGNKKTIHLVVNLVSDKEKTLIEFINDGNPLPANFNIDDYIQYGKKSGESSGQGLGGYLINRVVKNHGGEIDILPSGKKFKTSSGIIEATVHFSLSIPKNL